MESTKEKAPITGLIDVSVIAPGTVVYYKHSKNMVTKSTVEYIAIKPLDGVLTNRYALHQCQELKFEHQVFSTAEEAFKD